MIVYGRNPVREALRGRRKINGVWATRRAAESEQWLGDARPQITDQDEIERRCGSLKVSYASEIC